MHELDAIARSGYSAYNFPKGRLLSPFLMAFCSLFAVVTALSNFANITLSSFYLDITKDRLYANAPDSVDRRAVITVMEQVGTFSHSLAMFLTRRKILDTMMNVMGPIVPQLAQEIHEALLPPGEPITSVFALPWSPVVRSLFLVMP